MTCNIWFSKLFVKFYYSNKNIIEPMTSTICIEDTESCAVLIQKKYRIYIFRKKQNIAARIIQVHALAFISKRIKNKLVNIRTREFNIRYPSRSPHVVSRILVSCKQI